MEKWSNSQDMLEVTGEICYGLGMEDKKKQPRFLA